MDGFAVSFAGDAIDENEVFENLADFAVVHELEAVDVGHAVAEATGELNHFGEVGVWVRVVDAGVFEVLDHEFVRFENHAASDGLAGEVVGNVFELIIDGAVDLRNGVVEEGKRGFREDDGGDALGVALGVVAEFGDLLFGVDFGEFVIMKLGVTFVGVRVDVDGGEKFVQAFKGTEGNGAVFGDGIVVGVDLDGITPMDAVGDGHGKEKDGVAGEFGETGSGIKKEEVMVVELFELHDFGFDEALAVAESLARGAKVGLGRRVGAVREFFNDFLKLVEVEVSVFFDVLGLNRSLFCHVCLRPLLRFLL